MAPQKGDLMSVRPDIRVVDCTLRDGGLVNNFEFSDSFVQELYKTNLRVGTDYMEMGYKADRDLFDPEKFGKWKFCNDEDIYRLIGDNKTDLKLAAMADVGRTNYKRDIVEKANSPLDMIRVATYIHTIPAALDMVEYCKNMGYEVTCNIMAISKAQEDDVTNALEMICSSDALDAVFIVDSYGSLYPEQIKRISDLYLGIASKYDKAVGIHSHNNQQLAFANTIEACANGVSYLDASMNGMGRGSGNCMMEQLIGFLKNPKYQLFPVVQFVQKHMSEIRAQGYQWGYDLSYLMTGRMNLHPSSAISFMKDGRTDYDQFYLELLDRD